MPKVETSIITRTRANNKGVTEKEMTEYLEALLQVEEMEDDNARVVVDESEKETYEKAYARGERIRLALVKAGKVPAGKKVQVIAYKEDGSEKYVSAMRLKDEA